jgi:hypothetical protein
MSTSPGQLSNPVPRRLALFGAALIALFALGVAAGRVFEPGAPGAAAAPEGGMAGHGSGGAADGHGSGAGQATGSHGGHASAGEATPVRGLAVAEGGLRLVVVDHELPLGVAAPLRFRIVDAEGDPVRRFDVLHTKRMHLILARRDLTGFQHLHPRLGVDGAWTAPVRIDAPGSYRLFADFSHEGEATTLAADLAVDGDAELQPLPALSPTATSDGGYDVKLLPSPSRAGAETELRFAVSRDGHPVATEPYLGAGGHLVALREGDLAFLHVHPVGDSLAFAATFPTAGGYRLFLQFKVDGRVETVAFTKEVE